MVDLLPPGFRFRSIATTEFSDEIHHRAIFTWRLRAFVLIPGQLAELGYDPAQAAPLPEYYRQWEEETRYELTDLSLDDFLAWTCTPVRRVLIAPFVAQAWPTKLGFTTDWNWRPSASRDIHHADVARNLAAEGMRLPSSDEWEYTCSAGARTFFRWGNTCPIEEIPEFTARWDQHRRANAFGLTFLPEYKACEMCEEVGLYRNADGGTIGSISAGTYSEWIPLASSFVYRWPHPLGHCYIRPVVALGEDRASKRRHKRNQRAP